MNQENGMAHTRSDDPPVKITREIPLPWLVGIVAAGFLQAALMYFKQETQGAAIEKLSLSQTEEIRKLSTQVQQLSTDIGTKNLKDVEHDLKIADHERRVLSLEARTK